jgi:hypothetical protein
MSFFKHFNPETGRFHRALPYQEEEYPRRIRGPVTDAELDHFRQDRLQLRKEGGPDTYVNEMMIVLLLFLQKQSLAFAVYLFGIGTLHTGPGLKKKHM